MALFRKKPVVVEATQWLSLGGTPNPVVTQYDSEADYVDCQYCGGILSLHGWVKTMEGGHIVCPGDWIITGIKGEHYPCKPDIFKDTYEPV